VEMDCKVLGKRQIVWNWTVYIWEGANCVELDCIGLGVANCVELDCIGLVVANCVDLYCIGLGVANCVELDCVDLGVKLSGTGLCRFGVQILSNWTV
jgi:hypothetical protein